MEKTFEDFLTPDINQIRHSIRGIDDSYNNSWDIYAELIQNGVDAIRQSDVDEGNIVLEIDCPKRKIIIIDNGIGINKDELPYLLKPFGTNKSNIDAAIGEKGVGLKFVIFSSSLFKIKTGNASGTSEAEIRDAYNWKQSTDDVSLILKVRTLEEQFSGTHVEVTGVDNERIFNLSFEQLIYVLRTRTALGTTKPIWEDDRNIKITVKYKDINSKSFEGEIPFRYWLPTDMIPDNSKIDLDEFESWIKETDRTDQEKMTKLKDKIIYKKGTYTHQNQRIIKFFSCFVPKRKVWNTLSVRHKLAHEENLLDNDWLDEYYFCKMSNGIYTSIKGMPTGISVDHPSTGYAGYWANIFILFEDPFLRFDIGRKSIHGRQANIHREYAKRIFNEFLQYVTKYVSGDIVVEPTEWDRDEIFAEIEKIRDLNIDGVRFRKLPSNQEASVSAIFYECIGSGKIQNIIPLISGYRNKYDLYALWGKRKIIIEFKSQLSNLAKDFNDARKMFDEIDCVVCWEITDRDKQIMYDMGVNLEEIDVSMFARESKKLPHSTHIMNITGFTNPIYVIDLKMVLSK